MVSTPKTYSSKGGSIAKPGARDGEARYRAIFDHAAVGITLHSAHDPATPWIAVNAKFCAITGYTREELLRLVPADVVRIDEQEGQGGGRSLQRVVRKDGRSLRVSASAAVLPDSKGRPGRIITVYQDIAGPEAAQQAPRGDTAEDAAQKTNRELRELAEHLQEVREAERARIAHEIHDELGAALTAVKLDISWYVQKGTGGRRQLDKRLEDALAVVDAAIRTVKRIATELRPSLLDNLGLMAAIEWQVAEFRKRTRIRCRTDLGRTDAGVSPQVETAIFRMVQESLTNVARHAHASELSVTARAADGMLRVEITDNGDGFDESRLEKSTSLGIRGMIERARMHQGEVRIVGSAGHGTRVSIAFPVARDRPDELAPHGAESGG